jgi:hypothetical protein
VVALHGRTSHLAVALMIATLVAGCSSGATAPQAPAKRIENQAQLEQALAGINEPIYTDQAGFSPDAKRLLDIVSIQGALIRYKVANREYPLTLDGLLPQFAPGGAGDSQAAIPTDPSGVPYYYARSADGREYTLYAVLSNGSHFTGFAPTSELGN